MHRTGKLRAEDHDELRDAATARSQCQELGPPISIGQLPESGGRNRGRYANNEICCHGEHGHGLFDLGYVTLQVVCTQDDRRIGKLWIDKISIGEVFPANQVKGPVKFSGVREEQRNGAMSTNILSLGTRTPPNARLKRKNGPMIQ